MKTRALLLLVVSLAASCSSRIVEVSEAGSTTGGGGGGAGGADGGPTCEALVADLAAKIAAARACTSVGTWDECDISAWTKDECGCQAPLNHVSTAEVAAAQAASEALVAAGCTLPCAPQTCADRYNDPSYNGGCMATSNEMGLCTFAGAA